MQQKDWLPKLDRMFSSLDRVRLVEDPKEVVLALHDMARDFITIADQITQAEWPIVR